MRQPDAVTEARLDDLRRRATEWSAEGKGEGYYGLPLLKPPVWTWEVPTYFFVGGAAGAAAFIGFAARVARADPRLERDARWIAAIGAALSAPLLIADLGRPERFLMMLRVFKPKSPMSAGAWIVATFGATATASLILRGRLRDVAHALSALLGLGMVTYTGVLLGATTIPVWSRHAKILPLHFGASGLGSAAAILDLRGHKTAAIRRLAIAAAAGETIAGAFIEGRGLTDMTTRIGGVFSGPIPLLIRLLHGKSKRARQAAAVSTLLGSLLTRFAWVEAGRESARRSH